MDISKSVSSYRPEIDGLRAIAVLAVIINHFNKDLLPSGYLGVDIFFVISGYVITASLAKRTQKNFKEFIGGFYGRRVKRLMPALVLCVIISSIIICLFEVYPIASLRTGIASLFGVSNLYLLKQATDYFGVWAERNIFTHTWSLGVEEQFYLLFPFLVWLTGFTQQTIKGAKNLFWLMCVLSTASLVSFIHFNAAYQPGAYFLMTSRFWEMGAGSLLFLFLYNRKSFLHDYLKKLPAGIAILCLLAIMFVPSQFIVLVTIACVLLTAIAITSLRPQTKIFNLLTQPQVVFIGLISYSLYLWHWAVIVLSKLTVGINLWTFPIQLLFIVLASLASYYWVEKPFRHKQWSNSQGKSIVYGITAYGMATVLLIGLLSSPARALYTGSKNQQKPDNISEKKSVIVQDKKQGNIILIGDSHANHYKAMVEQVAEELRMNSKVVAINATIFPTMDYSSSVGGMTLAKNQNNNKTLNKRVYNQINRLDYQENNIIILSSYLAYYFGQPRIGTRRYERINYYLESGVTENPQDALVRWLKELKKFAQDNQNTKIVVMFPTPEMPDLYPLDLCTQEWFRRKPSDKCFVKIEREELTKKNEKFTIILRREIESIPNLVAFDPFALLCPESEKYCHAVQDNQRLYSDENHLTLQATDKIRDNFLQFLQRLTKEGFSRHST